MGSEKAWNTARLRRAALWVTVLGGLIGALTAAHAAADTHYITRAEYRFDRQGDSLTHGAEVQNIYRMLSGLDSTDKCRRGRTEFCR